VKRLFWAVAIALIFTLGTASAVFASQYYVVKQGDSLWSIARENGTTVEKLVSLNNLKSEKLQVGDKLLLPSGNTTSPAGGGKDSINRGGTRLVANQEYTVQQGDSLWSIARRYGMTVKELMEINGLASEKLKPGDKLLVKRIANTAVSPAAVQPVRQQVVPARGLEADTARARSIINTAMQYLGVPYRYGGTTSSGFDCSGFVMHVFAQNGMSLPHSSRAQYDMGIPVDRADLAPADLVFFTTGGASRINHVGIYVGDGKFIHASTNKGITITSLSDDTYASDYVGARRVLP